VSLTLELARARFDAGDYVAAQDLLMKVYDDASAPPPTSARILLAQARARIGDFDAATRDLDQATREMEAGADPDFRPLLDAAAGELAYAMNQPAAARGAFARAAAFWTDEFPSAASVESRAYLGLLDALEGRVANGRAHLRTSLEQAQRMRRPLLEGRVRLHLAQLEIGARNFTAALGALDAIPADDNSRRLGDELRAQVLYWRSRALAGAGDPAAAGEAERSRRLAADVAARVPDSSRARFLTRPDIRVLAGQPAS